MVSLTHSEANQIFTKHVCSAAREQIYHILRVKSVHKLIKAIAQSRETV